ncbi:NAD(P)/FAD-dependent oxidoreductase [Methylobacter tundripaludum]|uniref:FAD dependent oxidoreductase n=1 Tax=Methylobacter tundripaludum (strain ATCC BAA-1195 / DSM 17260 / SV96) TaxID=697282 RepID=G3J2E2_METTV|nr:FAD-binding oxidoreductase [Methylobacter tundripaludum]EGW19898.1 FAD dependent oxidoreductase [Methylobacter tundripaludum SV96]
MIDFLIIGQGLAGSLLAWELIQRGCKVVIVDNGRENASQVAAGLINPVTGMRFVKSADVDTLLPTAKHCYSQLADFFQQDFYSEKPMLRIFRSDSEFTNAHKRLSTPDYQAYLGDIQQPGKAIDNLATPFGFLKQKKTGYLLTRPLLSCLKAFFIANDSYRQADFDYRDIQLQPSLRWQDIAPKQIIFCEGYQATQNPWFCWLPFQPVKGEILTLQHQTELPDKILNYGNWLIPLNAHQIRIGATFDRENLDTQPTEQGKNDLLNALNQVSPGLTQANLINHQANIRPCTQDRQPFIGLHPQHKQLAIFNGFGAKGSLQIPWYSRHFADALLNGAPLPHSSNIQRHYETHFTG